MSSEERQRQLREHGSRPGEAQKQEEARRGREALEQTEAERAGSRAQSPDEPAPLAEEAEDRPTPRRSGASVSPP
jgi:hypothetical protein